MLRLVSEADLGRERIDRLRNLPDNFEEDIFYAKDIKTI